MRRSIVPPSACAAWIAAAMLFAPGAPAQEIGTQPAEPAFDGRLAYLRDQVAWQGGAP